MYSLFQSDVPGYGIFSLEGASVLLCCLLLMSLLHPATLIAARLGDLVQGFFKSLKSDQTTDLRGLETSSFAMMGSGFLLRGEARVPAYALFALMMAHQGFGTEPSAIYALTSSGTLLITAYVIVGLFALTAFVDNLKTSWNTLSGSRIAGFVNLLALSAPIVGFIMSGFQPEWLLSSVALGFTSRILMLISIRGLTTFGFGAVLWVPIMAIIWAAMTCIGSIIGPLMRLFDIFVEVPKFSGIPLGFNREEQLSKAEISIPRSYSLDGYLGAQIPR
jgi:hypothetical protein